MPTFTHGSNAVVILDKTNLSTTLTDASFSSTSDVAETSTFSSTSKSYVSGLTDNTSTLSGFYESSSPDADAEFLTELGGAGAAYSIAPIGYTRGNPLDFGTTTATSYDRSADINSIVSVAVALQFSGDAYNGKSLVAPAAFTATSTETSVDFGATGSSGGSGILHVTAKSGTSPQVIAKIQHSANDSSWSDYFTFTTATAETSEIKTSASSVNRYIRAVLTISGSTPSLTIAVGFAQN
tara:strand:- start:4920 stop:5636 length:717 start_codon:yes stop_codon:yes gene_type:complete